MSWHMRVLGLTRGGFSVITFEQWFISFLLLADIPWVGSSSELGSGHDHR